MELNRDCNRARLKSHPGNLLYAIMHARRIADRRLADAVVRVAVIGERASIRIACSDTESRQPMRAWRWSKKAQPHRRTRATRIHQYPRSLRGRLIDTKITIVSGLPRSGTSMMMQMLAAGGLSACTDGLRSPDDSNPRGYFESERVKTLAEDSSWVCEYQGQVLKVVSPLLGHLPDNLDYNIIFMDRPLKEILASQTAMMTRLGNHRPDQAIADAQLEDHFANHIRNVCAWLAERANMQVQHIDYRHCVESPLECAKLVNDFLGLHLDLQRMAASVDMRLYRERVG